MSLIKEVDNDFCVKCSIFNCINKKETHPKVAFFKISLNAVNTQNFNQTYPLWVDALDNTARNKTVLVICENHFDNKMITKKGSKKFLLGNAYPSKLTCKQNFATDANIEKKILIALNLKSTISKENPIYLIKMLKLFTILPKTYKILQSVLSLPDKDRLLSVFNSLDVRFAFNSLGNELLAAKIISFTKTQRKCYLALECIEVLPYYTYDCKIDRLYGVENFGQTKFVIKPISKALVLYACGIHSNWCLPIDVIFFDDEKKNRNDIKLWLNNAYYTISAMNLHILAFMCPITLSLTNHEEPNSSFLEMPLTNNVINYLYHIPSLFKMFYYYIFKYDYCYNNKVAKGTYITDYYNIDKTKGLLTPSITNYDHSFTNYEDISDEFISEFFHKRTITAMHTYVLLKLLKTCSLDTIILIHKMATLYDILCLNKKKTIPINKINEIMIVIILLSKMKLVIQNTDQHVNNGDELFVSKFMLALQSTLHVLSGMCYEQSFKIKEVINCQNSTNYIKNKLRLDCIPNSEEVVANFKQIFIENVLKPMKPKPIKEKLDLGNALDAFVNKGPEYTKFGNNLIQFEDNSNKLNTNYPTLIEAFDKITKHNKNDWIIAATALIWKECCEIHTCTELTEFINQKNESVDQIRSILPVFYTKKSVIPHDNFIEFIEMLEMRFLNIMNEGENIDLHDFKICRGIVRNMSDICFNDVCQCFPSNYSKELFVVLRLNLYCNILNSKWDKTILE